MSLSIRHGFERQTHGGVLFVTQHSGRSILVINRHLTVTNMNPIKHRGVSAGIEFLDYLLAVTKDQRRGTGVLAKRC
jgi:hypothetical protein